MKKNYSTPQVRFVSLYTIEAMSTSSSPVTSQAELGPSQDCGWSVLGEEDADGIWGN